MQIELLSCRVEPLHNVENIRNSSEAGAATTIAFLKSSSCRKNWSTTKMDSSDSIDFDSTKEGEEREQRKLRNGTLLLLCKLILKHPFPLMMGFSTIVLGTFATLLEPRIFGYAIDEAIVPKD